jgi:anti-sigma B factor antagonist
VIKIEKKENAPTLISIQDEMTICNVLEQKNILYPHLRTDHDLQIDLSDVSEIDGAGMQLLIFLKHQAHIEKGELRFINHSEAVVEVVNIFNLSSFFNDPVVLLADRKGS